MKSRLEGILAAAAIIMLISCVIPPPQPPTPPTPTPTPGPTPAPTTTTTTMTPVPPTCPVKVEGDYFVDIRVSMIGVNPQQYTATALYCGFPLRSDIFARCGSKCCTLGVDGGNQNAIVCEQVLSGTPVWHSDGTLTIIPAFDGNPYNAKATSGSGNIWACGISGCSNKIMVNLN